MSGSRERHPHGLAITVLFMAFTLLTLTAGEASAGRYHVYSCRTPHEQVAPVNGWTRSTSVESASVVAKDTCEAGGALIAGLNDGVRHEVGTQATWTFTVPSWATMTSATLWRAGDVDGGHETNAYYSFWFAGPVDEDSPEYALDGCAAGLTCKPPEGEGSTSEVRSPSNVVTVPAKKLGEHLYMSASCAEGEAKAHCPEGKGDPGGYAAVVHLYAADILLEQTASPTYGNVEGELASDSVVSGTAHLLFHAEDPGSGVYEAIFTVDGTEAGRTVLDSNGERCKQVGESTDGLPDFLYLQPCETSLSADVSLDTTTLSNGEHHLVVSVTDAASNRTVVLDRGIAVSNALPSPGGGTSTGTGTTSGTSPSPSPSPPNGTNASSAATLSVRWGSTAKRNLRGRYGHARTIVGRLTSPGGLPIAGALVEVAMTPDEQDPRSASLASARTSAGGRFRVRVPAGAPSSRLTLSYASHTTQTTPDVTASLSLTVHAGLSLHVAPHVSHAGGTIVFRGVLHGRPLPAGGKQLVLQASSPGSGWRTFEVLTTDRRGRYRSTYRFRLPGPVVYRFRALCPQESDFPYATGSSNVVLVRER